MFYIFPGLLQICGIFLTVEVLSYQLKLMTAQLKMGIAQWFR